MQWRLTDIRRRYRDCVWEGIDTHCFVHTQTLLQWSDEVSKVNTWYMLCQSKGVNIQWFVMILQLTNMSTEIAHAQSRRWLYNAIATCSNRVVCYLYRSILLTNLKFTHATMHVQFQFLYLCVARSLQTAVHVQQRSTVETLLKDTPEVRTPS